MTFNASRAYDDNKIRDILAVIAFQLLENTATGGIEKFVDFFADQFEDETGIDAANCIDQTYDAANDRYTLTAGTTAGSWGLGAGAAKAALKSPGTKYMGFRWTPSGSGTLLVTSVKINLNLCTGSCVTFAEIYSDNAGYPLTQVGVDSGNVTLNSTGDKTFTFATPVPVTAGTPYWVVIGGTLTDCEVSCTVPDAAFLSGYDSATITSIDDQYGGVVEWKVQIQYQNLSSLTLVSNAVTAESNDPSVCRVILLVDLNSVTITINTDLKAWVSIDNGSNYEQVTLTYRGVDGTGRAIYSGDEPPTARADNRIKVKAQINNSKNIYIKAWGVLWKY